MVANSVAIKDYLDYWKTISEVVRIMKKRAHCHIIFVLDRSRDGFQQFQFYITGSVSLLGAFDSATIELRKQGHLQERAAVIHRVGIHSDAAAVTQFQELLGYDDAGRGPRRPRVQIITTCVNHRHWAEEILWDSQVLKEKADGDQD